MGFLRKLFGGQGGQASSQVAMNVNYFKRIRDDAVLQVVGEAYRQDKVALARPPSDADLPPGLPAPPAGYYKAMLFPEQSNEYDSNAIAVVIWAGGDWAIVGYLSRADAANYQPLFRHLAVASKTGSPPAIACDAALVSEHGGRGVVLHLGTPGECAAELATDDIVVAPHPWTAKPVAVTGHSATTIYGVPLDRAGQVMLIRWAGCELVPRLTRKTDALIVANPDDLTGNLQRARDYGVAIVEEPDFLYTIGIPADVIGRVSARWARG